MREEQHALELGEEGLYNTYSLLRVLNSGKKKDERISKKEFYDKLRRAGFLATGMTAKPHDPVHNKPYRWIREKGWALKRQLPYHPKGCPDITNYYVVTVYTKTGLKVIEKILFDPSFNLHGLKFAEQKPAEIVKPQDAEKNAQAGAETFARLGALLNAG